MHDAIVNVLILGGSLDQTGRTLVLVPENDAWSVFVIRSWTVVFAIVVIAEPELPWI